MGRFGRKAEMEDSSGATAAELQVLRDVFLHSPPRTTLTFGAPTRCPRCGDFGFVRSVEHGRGVCENRCLSCHHDWVITARALAQQTQVKAELTAELAERLIPPPAMGRVPEPDPAPEPARAAADPDPDPAPIAVDPAPVATRAPLPIPPRERPRPAFAAATAPEPVLSAIVERAMQDAIDERRAAGGSDLAPVASTPASPAPPTPVVPTDEKRVPVVPYGDGDRPVRLLVIEDNPFDYAILEMIFDEAGPSVVDVTHVMTFAEGFDHSTAEPFDVILLDLNLPDSSGFSTIESWQEGNDARTPVIAMSSITDPELPSAARDSGVAYFVRKTQIEELTLLDRGADRFVQLLQTTIRKSGR